MRVDSGQFFLHYRHITKIVEESQRDSARLRKDRFGDTSLPLFTMVSVPRRGLEGEKNRKKFLRLVNAAMSKLPAKIFLCDQCGCFLFCFFFGFFFLSAQVSIP